MTCTSPTRNPAVAAQAPNLAQFYKATIQPRLAAGLSLDAEFRANVGGSEVRIKTSEARLSNLRARQVHRDCAYQLIRQSFERTRQDLLACADDADHAKLEKRLDAIWTFKIDETIRDRTVRRVNVEMVVNLIEAVGQICQQQLKTEASADHKAGQARPVFHKPLSLPDTWYNPNVQRRGTGLPAMKESSQEG